MTTQTWDADRALERIRALADLPGAMLPVLHALQEEFGYVDPEAIPLIADALNVSRAEVVGVIHFYHDFRETPPGRHLLQVCRAEACQSMGCEALVEHVEQRLGVSLGETTPDGAFTTDTVYCLGNCSLSPSVLLDGFIFGRVTPDLADRLINNAEARS